MLAEVCPLQERLKPILLRRMKEDVETLPEKEEIVVWVQLTKQQLLYYKALMSKEVRWWSGVKSWPSRGQGCLFMEQGDLLAEPPDQGCMLLGSCLWVG